jgi:hypothetical protein
VALVSKRTIPTERQPLVGEVSANFCGSAQRIPTTVNLGFLDRRRYIFIQVTPQLSSRGWADLVSNPLLLIKSARAGNRTRDLCICSQKLWLLDVNNKNKITIREVWPHILRFLLYLPLLFFTPLWYILICSSQFSIWSMLLEYKFL